MTATIGRVSRPRGSLTPYMQEQVEAAQRRLANATEEYRGVVVALLYAGCSFAEVSKATGLSTNTLQRWKREADK